MKNVLITGSGGFIGKHLCRYLKEKGVHITGTGRGDSSAAETDEYIKCDLAHDDAEVLMNGRTYDTVIHLATDSRVMPYAVEAVTANCAGTQKLLDMCSIHGIGSFIQLSSLPIIGEPKILPIKEDHPLAPPTIYHSTKALQEFLCNCAEKNYGLRTVSLRLASPIGKSMRTCTIFPTFMLHALKNEKLTVFGKGTRKQAYIYMPDVVGAIWAAAEGEAHGVFNLTSGMLISNRDLAELIVKCTGSSSAIELEGDDPMDSFVWDTDISKLENELGYSPEYRDMEAVIKEMAEYYRTVSD